MVKNLAKPGSGGQDAYPRPSRSSSSPTVCWRCRSRPRSSPSWPASWPARTGPFIARSSLGVRLIALLHLPGRVGLFVLARPIIGDVPAARQVHRAAADTHRPGAGRLLPRPGRLLGLPVRPARLLRPPGHPDAVPHQPRRERAQHRARGRARRPLRRARAGPGVRPGLPAQRGVGAAGAVLQGPRLRAGPIFASLGRMLLGRRC